MKYYKLQQTKGLHIQKVHSQLETADDFKTTRIYGLDYPKPIKDKDIPTLNFKENAILVDYIAFKIVGVGGFVVSEKFKNLLETLINKGIKTNTYQFLPLRINNCETSYYYFHLIPNFDIIDFKNTIFRDLDDFFTNKPEGEPRTKISSMEEFRKDFILKELALKKDCDILLLPYINEVLISEKIKNVILENEITGIEKPRAVTKISERRLQSMTVFFSEYADTLE